MFAKYCKSVAALVLGAVTAVAVGTTPVQASISFTLDSYTVSANSGSGLIIQTADILSQPYSFDLSGVGDSHTVNLFKIWTNEEELNLDDLVERPISVDFDFTAPLPEFGGTSEGSTVAGTIGLFSWGSLDWDGAIVLNFGPNGDGELQVTLSDETFNKGLFGFKPGAAHGAKVKAKFKLLQEPSAPVVVIPEPATVLVWGGLALVGLAVGRRRFVR